MRSVKKLSTQYIPKQQQAKHEYNTPKGKWLTSSVPRGSRLWHPTPRPKTLSPQESLERLTRARISQGRKLRRLGGKGGSKQSKGRGEGGEEGAFYRKEKTCQRMDTGLAHGPFVTPESCSLKNTIRIVTNESSHV